MSLTLSNKGHRTRSGRHGAKSMLGMKRSPSSSAQIGSRVLDAGNCDAAIPPHELLQTSGTVKKKRKHVSVCSGRHLCCCRPRVLAEALLCCHKGAPQCCLSSQLLCAAGGVRATCYWPPRHWPSPGKNRYAGTADVLSNILQVHISSDLFFSSPFCLTQLGLDWLSKSAR